MSTTALKASGWVIVVCALFAFSARSTLNCNGTKPSALRDCVHRDTCESHQAPCPAHATIPEEISTNCEGGTASDHCKNKAAEPTGSECEGRWICARKYGCVTVGMNCAMTGPFVGYVCTSTPLKVTATCNVP